MQVRNLSYNARGTIDCEIEHPALGWIPFTASPGDVEELGRSIYAAAMTGEHGEIAPYVAPVPTVDELARQYEREVQQHLDATAKGYGYDDIKSAVTYADEPAVPRFQIEGLAFRAWRSLCWDYCYSLLDAVQAGTTPLPALEDVIAGLPALEVSYGN
ncbi:hypothetical protein ACFSKY_06255 [Azotobacter chroococcum]|uniref:Uncharacterized protein n=1 Tax=Azotobacter chroococcum TaxID=353 RepID=A0A4R1PML2_9GAMM|nr:hypothetical protein [Azotobacter chroococcum]TBV91311.1 hypothetical protein E0E53_21475 [Azotobacter chroococcum]TCL32535.1 hypothetical protein EV691_10761 [Azotobacter chroococcum]